VWKHRRKKKARERGKREGRFPARVKGECAERKKTQRKERIRLSAKSQMIRSHLDVSRRGNSVVETGKAV